MTKTILLLGVSALFAGSIGVGALSWRGEPSKSDARATESTEAGDAPPRASATASFAARPHARLWRPARAATYALKLESVVESEAGDPLLRLELRGNWKVESVQQSDGLGLRAVLRKPHFEVEGTNPDRAASDQAALTEAFARPIYWMVPAPGAVEQMRGQKRLAGTARDVWMTLVSLVQLVRPESPAATWSTTEDDHMGRFGARYTWIPGDGSLQKQKLSYTDPVAGRLSIGSSASHDIMKSSTRFTLKAGTGLVRLQADDHVVARTEPPIPALGARTRVELELTDTAPASITPEDWRAEFERAVALSRPAAADSGPDFDRMRVGERRLPEVLARRSLAKGEEKARLFGILVSLFRIDDAAVQEARRRILDGDPEANGMIAALGTASTPATQRVLKDVASHRNASIDVRFRALRSLSLTSEPTAETAKVLHDHLDDAQVGAQAKLGLGSVIRRLRPKHPRVAEQLLSSLTRRLAKAQTAEEKVAYLDALGNAGQKSALAVIAKHLTDSSASIRSSAARALRRISGEGADELLAQTMLRDSSPEVRKAAVTAVRQRSPSAALASALTAAIREDDSTAVQQAAIQAARFWMGDQPALKAAVERTAQHGSDARVREAAALALGTE